MNIKENIYKLSPIWFQDILISVYGWKLYRMRYKGIYSQELERLKLRNISNIEKQKEIQNKMFMDFLAYTIKYSPFYKEFYKDVDLSQIKSVDDIHLLPILDKQ